MGRSLWAAAFHTGQRRKGRSMRTATLSSSGWSGTITSTAVTTFSPLARKPHTSSCASHGRHEGGLPYSPLRR